MAQVLGLWTFVLEEFGHNVPDYISQAFFYIGRRKNSSTKLKEKTQPQGGTFLLLRETQETQFFPKISKK